MNARRGGGKGVDYEDGSDCKLIKGAVKRWWDQCIGSIR